MNRQHRVFFVGVLALGALLYAPHIPAPFVADDHFILWRLREGGAFGFATQPPTGFYRPLISLHYYLDYSLWGMQPFWSHLVDVGWHLLCGGLVALFCLRWQQDRGGSHAQAVRAALLAMTLFLVLPAHVEAVAWFAARADMVAAAAALACLLLLRACVRSGRKVYEWLALLCFTAGLFAKESLLPFPLVVWLWLRWLGAPRAGWRTLPYWGILGLFWWLRSQAVGGLGAYPAAWETLRQPWQLGVHLAVYLLQLPMPTILFGLGRAPLDTLLWLAWAIGMVLVVRGLWHPSPVSSPQRRAGLLLFSFALLSLLPVLLFKPSPWHFLNSRYSYLASVWLVVWVAGMLAQGWERAQVVRWGVLALILVYAAGTVRQVTAWAVAGSIAQSTLQSLKRLPANRPIVLISVPDHYRGAYIWRAGLPEAIRFLLPEHASLVYALSRFTMRLQPDTAVIYSAGTARLSRREDLFLPPEGLELPPDSVGRWRVQPER
ncbi:MAG: hypothetical protein NZL85_00335, partial [Fimbriimonadales bacterium]|nr:hypothetical protein [Fimbriimonadales bacterium]